jgi:predicted small secreted protein
MKKLIAATVAVVLCSLFIGCRTIRRDRGLYGKDIPITRQSILIVKMNTIITSFDGDKVRWGKKHGLMDDWEGQDTPSVQVHIPSGAHDLTLRYNTSTWNRRGADVVFKNTITKEFLPGHCYFISGILDEKTGHRRIWFTDWTKSSGSESFVEDKDGNLVTEQP